MHVVPKMHKHIFIYVFVSLKGKTDRQNSQIGFVIYTCSLAVCYSIILLHYSRFTFGIYSSQ